MTNGERTLEQCRKDTEQTRQDIRAVLAGNMTVDEFFAEQDRRFAEQDRRSAVRRQEMRRSILKSAWRSFLRGMTFRGFN